MIAPSPPEFTKVCFISLFTHAPFYLFVGLLFHLGCLIVLCLSHFLTVVFGYQYQRPQLHFIFLLDRELSKGRMNHCSQLFNVIFMVSHSNIFLTILDHIFWFYLVSYRWHYSALMSATYLPLPPNTFRVSIFSLPHQILKLSLDMNIFHFPHGFARLIVWGLHMRHDGADGQQLDDPKCR